MKANELRIGNIVLCETGITEIDITDFADKPFLRSIKPVPLTEEWLEKFGFKYIEGLWVKKDLSMGLKNTDYDGDGNKWHFVIGYMLIEIKHVHQLQNLYFALTGEELEIKE